MQRLLLLLSGFLSTTVVGLLMFLHPVSMRQVPAQPAQVQAVPVSFTDLGHGTQSKITERVNYLITSPVQLSELWLMLGTNSDVPTVDFSKNDVIAVFSGSEPTGGYAIAVTAVADASDRHVTVTLTQPGGSCLLSQMVTSPYDVVSLPKSPLTLTHEDQVSTVSCLQ